MQHDASTYIMITSLTTSLSGEILSMLQTIKICQNGHRLSEKVYVAGPVALPTSREHLRREVTTFAPYDIVKRGNPGLVLT